MLYINKHILILNVVDNYWEEQTIFLNFIVIKKGILWVEKSINEYDGFKFSMERLK